MQRDPIGGLTELTREECRQHLQRAEVGRLAITYKALPVVIPVRIDAKNDNWIIVASLYGDVIPLPAGSIVALEAGTLGEDGAEEWSVEVRGFLTINGSSEFQLSTEVLAGWARS